MNEYMVKEHLTDLVREADAYRRVASRADRATPRAAAKVTARLHRRPATMGCATC